MTTPRETTPGEAGPPRDSSAAVPPAAAPPRSAGDTGPQDGPAPAAAVPRAGSAPSPERRPDPGDEQGEPPAPSARPKLPADPGPGWAGGGLASEEAQPRTVLPGSRPARPGAPRPAAGATRPAGARPPTRSRRAQLSLRRIDPWSVFVFSLVASVFLGVALVVAVAVLYAVLGSLGVTGSLNELFAEVTGGDAATQPLLTGGRIIGGAAVLAAVNVVLLTLLATLGALLYNVCASFTGGLELTFGERD